MNYMKFVAQRLLRNQRVLPTPMFLSTTRSSILPNTPRNSVHVSYPNLTKKKKKNESGMKLDRFGDAAYTRVDLDRSAAETLISSSIPFAWEPAR